jgi:hypothetical protein
MPNQPPKKKSETRQRSKGVYIRLTDVEHEYLTRLAADAGLKRASYVRKCALGDPGQRSQKQPKPYKRHLGELLGQVGKIGSNINQLAHRANLDGFGAVNPAELKVAFQHISDMRAKLLRALGKDGY